MAKPKKGRSLAWSDATVDAISQPTIQRRIEAAEWWRSFAPRNYSGQDVDTGQVIVVERADTLLDADP